MEICLLMSTGVQVNKGTCRYRKWWHARDEVGAPSHSLCSAEHWARVHGTSTLPPYY